MNNMNKTNLVKLKTILHDQLEALYTGSFFYPQAQKLLERESFIFLTSCNNVALEVLLRLYEVVNANLFHTIVLHDMGSAVMIPYLLGLSQYDPFEGTHEIHNVNAPSVYSNGIRISTTIECYEVILKQIQTTFPNRYMLVPENKDQNYKIIIITPFGSHIPSTYDSKICDEYLEDEDMPSCVLRITIDPIITNYDKLRTFIPYGSGHHLRHAAYALIATGDRNIWAGISSSPNLQFIMQHSAPKNYTGLTEALKSYYCEFANDVFYSQLAEIIMDIMCMHLASPDDFFEALLNDRANQILDALSVEDIETLYWDPQMRDKLSEPYYYTHSEADIRRLKKIGTTCRDELLLCHAYFEMM